MGTITMLRNCKGGELCVTGALQEREKELTIGLTRVIKYMDVLDEVMC